MNELMQSLYKSPCISKHILQNTIIKIYYKYAYVWMEVNAVYGLNFLRFSLGAALLNLLQFSLGAALLNLLQFSLGAALLDFPFLSWGRTVRLSISLLGPHC